ncbi:MAG: hypothetical protein JO053_01040 [Acidobacteria bacterium]|nr:hypothetical protein [Acidobacteriota bacterium]
MKEGIVLASAKNIPQVCRRLVKRYGPAVFAYFVVVAGFVAGIKSPSFSLFAQSDKKSVSLARTGPSSKPQIKIKEVKIGGRSKELGEEFDDAPDWLQRTAFRVENVSQKTIVYLKVNLLFPETKTSGPLMAFPISFGRKPGSTLQSTADPLQFAPNATLDVSVSDRYSDLSRFLSERHSVESMHRIELEVEFVAFEDGTAWIGGEFMIQDPNNPNRYIPAPVKIAGERP